MQGLCGKKNPGWERPDPETGILPQQWSHKGQRG